MKIPFMGEKETRYETADSERCDDVGGGIMGDRLPNHAGPVGGCADAGVVSLTGEVPDIMTSAHASWTAWIVPGVKYVRNDLRAPE